MFCNVTVLDRDRFVDCTECSRSSSCAGVNASESTHSSFSESSRNSSSSTLGEGVNDLDRFFSSR